MKSRLWIMPLAVVACVALVVPDAAQAQEFKVLEERGQEVEEGGTTVLKFTSSDEVSVHRILSRSSAFGTAWNGAAVGGQGQTSSYLCTAPCTLEVPNGAYELRASDNPLFGLPFRVDATGGEQQWEVEDANSFLGVVGILGSGVGGGLALSGLILDLSYDDDDDIGLNTQTLLVVGIPMAVLGIWALVESFSSAERIR